MTLYTPRPWRMGFILFGIRKLRHKMVIWAALQLYLSGSCEWVARLQTRPECFAGRHKLILAVLGTDWNSTVVVSLLTCPTWNVLQREGSGLWLCSGIVTASFPFKALKQQPSYKFFACSKNKKIKLVSLYLSSKKCWICRHFNLLWYLQTPEIKVFRGIWRCRSVVNALWLSRYLLVSLDACKSLKVWLVGTSASHKTTFSGFSRRPCSKAVKSLSVEAGI